jgi:adenine-specific DNA methylase
MTPRKKLIEVALPLEAINEASVRQESADASLCTDA